MTFDVSYNEFLGEGEGHWDSDPRFPAGQVNCLTWLQYVLAEAYARNADERVEVMDAIRYFNSRVGFAYRKHFVDRWTELDPGPLNNLNSPACVAEKSFHVKLDLAKFRRSTGFDCELFAQYMNSFDVGYIGKDRLRRCVSSLDPGFYVMFGIASKRYLERYGSLSGPMAQVHAFLLEVPESTNAGHTVYHASTSRGRVVRESLAEMLEYQDKLHLGYSLYGLRPDWAWKAISIPLQPKDPLLACERSLRGKLRDVFMSKEKAQ